MTEIFSVDLLPAEAPQSSSDDVREVRERTQPGYYVKLSGNES